MPLPAYTLLVTPFEDLSGGTLDEGLVAGFAQDLIIELARLPQVSVIAVGNAAEAEPFLSRNPSEGMVCLLSGSFRPWGGGVRITARLEEAGNGRHLWAGRYDGGRLSEFHDEITFRIVNALEAGVDQSLLSRARRRPTETLEAYECWLRGMDCLQRGSAEADNEARAYFEQALRLDPHHAAAQAGISLSHFNEWSCQAWGKWEEKEAAAYAAARRAEAMDPDNPRILMVLARIEQYRREHDRAAPRLERALALAPNDAGVLIQLGMAFAFQGDAERGSDLALRAHQLNPLAPGWYHAFTAAALFASGRFEEAHARASMAPPNLVVDTPAYLAAAAAHLGRMEDAVRHLRAFRDDFGQRIAGGRQAGDGELLQWLMHVNPFRDPAHSLLLADGVRRAGLSGSPGGASPAEPPVPWTVANTFRREGLTWTLVYEHEAAALPDLRGLHDLSRLLARPGETFSAAELAGSQVREAGLESVDPAALAAYRNRLREIDAEFEEAGAAGDAARAELLEEEREALLAEVGRAVGLGNRPRKQGGSDERARGAVTWRIRHAIRKVAAVHPALGRHLANTVRTGVACGYFPEKPVTWHL